MKKPVLHIVLGAGLLGLLVIAVSSRLYEDYWKFKYSDEPSAKPGKPAIDYSDPNNI
jgi:hypothetical protein